MARNRPSWFERYLGVEGARGTMQSLLGWKPTAAMIGAIAAYFIALSRGPVIFAVGIAVAFVGALIGLLCVGLLRQLLGIENASNIDRNGD